MVVVNKTSAKTVDKHENKSTGLYKIAAKVIKKVKTGSSFKSELYNAQYPVKYFSNKLFNLFIFSYYNNILFFYYRIN